MLTDSYPANQAQNSSTPLSSSYLITQNARNQCLEFINESPSIDQESSKYLEKKLEEYEKKQHEKAKSEAQYQQKYGPKKRQTKAENRHRLIYTITLFNIAYIKVKPSRETIASIAGVHRNTFDNHKRELQKMYYLDWKSGKKTYETNTYYLPDHVKNQHIPRPKDFAIPWFLWKAIEKTLENLNWNDKQTIYQQILKDIVHHINSVYRKSRTFGEEKRRNSSKDPPKTQGSPKRPIFKRLLSEFKFNFKDQAILSSYGEGPLRASICDLNSYNGEVRNVVAFLISRCKAHQSKIQDQQELQMETPDQKLQWLKQLLIDPKMRVRLILQSGSLIDRSTPESKPFVNLLIHKKDLSKSKLIIEQKIHGTWIDKAISLGREKFRETILSSLEMAFKHSEGYQARVCC